MLVNFVQFRHVVKGHQINSFPGSILNVGGLLTGVGVDDAMRSYAQTQDRLDLILEWIRLHVHMLRMWAGDAISRGGQCGYTQLE